MSNVDLLRAKLYFPKQGKATVPRARLVERLSFCLTRPITTIVAPAGYGKTVLVSEWYAKYGGRTRAAYIALDYQDNDVAVFVAYLAEAFAMTGSDQAWSDGCRSCSSIADVKGAILHLGTYLERIEEEVVLFLDDYHVIESPEVHRIVARLLELRLENVRVVIMGRSLVGLPLARWRLEDSLAEVTTSDLVFNEREADELLSRHCAQCDASESDLAFVKEAAEGWAAGLRLAALAMSFESASAASVGMRALKGSKYAWQYLWEEVFCQQPEGIQGFLMATSVVDELSEPLCDALMRAWNRCCGEPDAGAGSARALRHLLDSNLFLVELAGEGEWYRYHHLLRDFASARLRTEYSEAHAELCKAACEWHLEHGFETKSIRQAMESGDWSYASDVVRRAGLKALSKGWGQPIIEWVDALPYGVVDQHPLLSVLRAWGYVLSSRAELLPFANPYIDFAEMKAGRESEDVRALCMGHLDLIKVFRLLIPSLEDCRLIGEEDIPHALALQPTEDPRAAGDLVLGWSALAANDLEGALRSFAKARELSLGVPHYFTYEDASFCAGFALSRSGRVQEAMRLCDASIGLLRNRMSLERGESPLVGPLLLLKGHLLMLGGSFDEARKALDSGLQLVGGCLLPHYQLVGYITLFDMHELKGESTEALAALVRMELAWPDVAFCADALRVEHYLNEGLGDCIVAELEDMLGDYVESAKAYAPRVGGLSPLHGGYAYERSWMAWLRLMVETGRQGLAASLIDRRMEAYGGDGPRLIVAMLLVIRSFALLADGREEEAVVQFHEATALALSGHCFRTLSLDRRFAVLLTKEKVYFGRDEGGKEGAGSRAGRTSAVLTGKEIQVIELAGRGLSNKGIARKLGISEGTVKQHMSRTMGKLSARNRTEAFLIAKEMGLLRP